MLTFIKISVMFKMNESSKLKLDIINAFPIKFSQDIWYLSHQSLNSFDNATNNVSKNVC